MRFITQAALCLLACASTLPGLGAATPVYATNSALSSESHYIEARAPISASQVVKWIPNAYSDTQTGWRTFVQAPPFRPTDYKVTTRAYARQVYDILQAKHHISSYK
jgi:hypothetical protein